MNWRNGHSPSKLHFGSTVTTEPSSRKTAKRWGLTSITVIACDSFKLKKSRQLFVGVHNEALSLVAVRAPIREPILFFAPEQRGFGL
jgi:hypothetical protein